MNSIYTIFRVTFATKHRHFGQNFSPNLIFLHVLTRMSNFILNMPRRRSTVEENIMKHLLLIFCLPFNPKNHCIILTWKIPYFLFLSSTLIHFYILNFISSISEWFLVCLLIILRARFLKYTYNNHSQ